MLLNGNFFAIFLAIFFYQHQNGGDSDTNSAKYLVLSNGNCVKQCNYSTNYE